MAETSAGDVNVVGKVGRQEGWKKNKKQRWDMAGKEVSQLLQDALQSVSCPAEKGQRVGEI